MSIARQSRRVADLLKRRQWKAVFAESCTGGLASGALTRIPGVSQHHCGGMVVYRSQTKAAYLGIPADLLETPGPVSREVTRRMAEEILRRTVEADVSAAITGHLGPGTPRQLDGVVFLCIARRNRAGEPTVVSLRRLKYPAGTTRQARQRQAVEDLLRLLGDSLSRK